MPHILAAGIAAEFHVQGDATILCTQAQDIIGSSAIDIALTPANLPRRKQLLVADMESTIIEQECFDELADMLGLGNEIATITARAMRGEIDFAQSLQERLRAFAGQAEHIFADLYTERITLMEGAASLIATMRHNGAICGLISGGFHYFASRIAAQLGFNHFACNDVEIVNQHLTGKIIPPILDRAAKATHLRKWSKAHETQHILAIGDGSNDLDMFAAAELSVAYRAKPVVAKAANIALTHSDLTALLYIQGYRGDEIISPKDG